MFALLALGLPLFSFCLAYFALRFMFFTPRLAIFTVCLARLAFGKLLFSIVIGHLASRS